MYPAGAFHESDERRLGALVAARGLAVIVACGPGPVAGHAPVLLSGRRLRFHLARANALCPLLGEERLALAVVTGADAYVSPDWYAAADQVPTWNYLSAEMEGPVRSLSRDDTAALLDDLAAHFEARLSPKAPWTRAKMSAARFETMLAAITGFEMTVDRFEGVSKLSQNKPDAERQRVAEALLRTGDQASIETAREMRKADREPG
jgi:transcriptional regulator